MKLILTAVRLEARQLRKLEKIAKREDRSVSYLIRKAVDQFIQTRKGAR